MKFRFLEHTADIKFQAFGKSVEEVFANSALAMFSAMCDDKVKKNVKKKIKVEGKDYESMMYNFLEELLFLFDSEGFFLGKVKDLKIKENKLSAEAVGDNAENYNISIDVKAVTYNEMDIHKEKKGGWVAQVVLDV